jgi:PleD family two-component response regulator
VARAKATVARFGGDAFAVLFDHCSRENAGRVGQQICNSLNDFRFIHAGKRFRISAMGADGGSFWYVPQKPDMKWAKIISYFFVARLGFPSAA